MADIPTINPNPIFSGGAVAPPYSGIDTNPLQLVSSSSSVNPSLLGTFASAGTSLLGKGLDMLSSHIQRKWSEKMFDKQNEWNLNMWNMSNAYNSPAAQKQRMLDAGLNPLNYSLDGSSASPMQSAQPLGYERSTLGISNPLQAGVDYAVKQAQLSNIEAQTNKIKSDTDSTQLDNEFKRKTLNLRVEGVALANSLSGKQIQLIDSQRDEISKRVNLLVEQAESEQVRRDLMHAEEVLRKVEARKLVELLPFEKALMSAQTQAQSAQASLAYWSAAIKQGLFEGGIVDYEIEQLITQIQRDESVTLKNQKEKDLLDLKNRIKSGHAINVDSIPKWMITDRIAATLWNSLMQRANEVTETMGGVIAPIVGYGLGKGAGAADGASYSYPASLSN